MDRERAGESLPVCFFQGMMHPGILLLSWVAGLAAYQVLHGRGALVGALVLTGLAWARGAAVLAQLVFRSRWLFVMLGVVYGWQTPGTRLAAGLGIGVSREGVVLAVEEAARLLGCLAWVALLLNVLPLSRLVAGLTWVFQAVSGVAGWRERSSLRLALLLEYLRRPVSAANLIDWLEGKGAHDELRNVWVEPLPAPRINDWGMLALAWGGFAVALAWGAAV